MKITDDKWLGRAESGSAESERPAAVEQEHFAELFQDCRPQLVKLCERILRESDAARDAVSETYVRAYQSRANFDGANFPGWLSRIAQRICIDRIRRRLHVQALEKGFEPASTTSEVRILTALQVRSILAKLPEQQRRCLKLFYIEGFSAREVSLATGFSDNKVKSYLQNGRRNFMQAWRAMEGKIED